MKIIAFVIAASLLPGAALLNAPADPPAAQPSVAIDPAAHFEYALVLDASEVEWLDCSWTDIRCP